MNYDAFMEPVSWFLTGMEKHSDEFREDLLGNGEVFASAMRYHMAGFMGASLLSAMNEEEFKEWRELVFKELGDIIWGVAGICEVLGTNLETIAEMNNEKLSSRQDRGKIDGSGDNR